MGRRNPLSIVLDAARRRDKGIGPGLTPRTAHS
jgi:hypothetical protein